jgi:hypothetical protein
MRRHGPFKPLIPALLLWLTVLLPAATLILNDQEPLGGALILVGGLGTSLYMRWYARKYLG